MIVLVMEIFENKKKRYRCLNVSSYVLLSPVLFGNVRISLMDTECILLLTSFRILVRLNFYAFFAEHEICYFISLFLF